MNEQQVAAIADVLRFLTSHQFTSPPNVKNLNNYCTKHIKRLNEVDVDKELVAEIQAIFNAETYKYL